MQKYIKEEIMEKFEHEYKAEQRQVGEGVEAVRKRPSM